MKRSLNERFPEKRWRLFSNYVATALAAEPLNVPESTSDSPLAPLQQQYLTACLSANRTEAVRLATEAIQSGVHVGEFYLDVLQPSQREIGRLWQAGEITVAQEHYGTAATQFVMSQLQPYFLQKRRCDRNLVACCVGDELHEVGLRVVSDIFEMEGWNTVYLGANVPPDSVVASLVRCRADVVAISTTMTRHLIALAELISAIRANPECRQNGMKILVGGYPFNVDPFLWKRVGADDGAGSATEAIRIASSYFSGKTPTTPDDPDPHTIVAPPGSDSPVESSPVESSPVESSPVESSGQDDLSRLNNDLITAQRQLHKANLELKQLNELNEQKSKALEDASRRKDEFMAMLAHELRGPLAPITHALAILQMENVDRTTVVEARETIQRQVQQMAHLISDLLDASRIAHGKIELKKARVNLSEIVERAVEIALPLIRQKSHDLHFEDSAESIFLEGDEIRLTQVFANLLSNAAKYTETKGAIWLSAELLGDRAVVRVRDNGIGIEADLLPQVFGAFTQEQRGRVHSQGGLGLGLSLVKQLVELHRGTVEAESGGAGQGCTFTVRLPALEPVACDAAEDDGNTEIPEDVVARRVLIADDAAGIARITARLFELLGHKPVIAVTGASAIEQFREFAPEIVVLDLNLPDISGFDVAREIRALEHGDRTLIVAQTGNSDAGHRQQAQQAGFDEYLVKPVDVAELRKLGTHPKLREVGGTRPHPG